MRDTPPAYEKHGVADATSRHARLKLAYAVILPLADGDECDERADEWS